MRVGPKKAKYERINAFQLWCWERLLRVLWTERRSYQSILKEISPEYSLEGLMLGLKLQYFQFSSVQCSCSVVSDSLRPHEPQHARLPCPSPTPRVHSNPCPLSRRCHSTISSFVVPFSSCPQSFPASGSFQMSELFTPGTKVLEFQLQHQSFQGTPRTDLL